MLQADLTFSIALISMIFLILYRLYIALEVIMMSWVIYLYVETILCPFFFFDKRLIQGIFAIRRQRYRPIGYDSSRISKSWSSKSNDSLYIQAGSLFCSSIRRSSLSSCIALYVLPGRAKYYSHFCPLPRLIKFKEIDCLFEFRSRNGD